MSNSSQEQSNSIFKPMQNNIWTAQILPNESIVSQIERQNAQRQKLAKYENEKGTEKFCDYVYQPPTTIMHHSVKNDYLNDSEDTEFLTLSFPKIEYGWFGIELGIEVTPPKFPLYVDIEYVEIGYVLYKRYRGMAFGFYFGFNSFKLFMQSVVGHGGNNFGHPPNKYGFVLGVAIARDFPNIQNFVNQWCVG